MSEVYFVQNGLIQDNRIQDGYHHHMNENKWLKFFLCNMAESKMAEFKMAEFKMAAIIKLIRLNKFESESEWSESVFEWIWEKITRCLNPKMYCLNSTWQNWRWLPSSSWVTMNEWSFFVQMLGTNLGKCEWVWEEILWWLNPRWWNSRW